MLITKARHMPRVAGVARYTPTEEGELYFDTPPTKERLGRCLALRARGCSTLRPYKRLGNSGLMGDADCVEEGRGKGKMQIITVQHGE